MGYGAIQFQPKRIKQINESQSVENKKPDKISGKKKGNVQPDLFAVKILIKPWENMVFTQEKDQKKSERNGEKAGKRFGQV